MMCNYYYCFIYVALVFCCYNYIDAASYDMKIKSWDEVATENRYFKLDDVKLKKINKTHLCFDGIISILRDDIPAADLKISILGAQKTSNGWQQSPLLYIDKRLFCETLETERMLIPDIKAASNYTSKDCPIPAGVYSITNYTPDPEKFPDNIPGEDWKITVHVFDKEDTISTAYLYLLIKRPDP